MQPTSTKVSHANHLSVQPESPDELTHDHDEAGTINRSFSHVHDQRNDVPIVDLIKSTRIEMGRPSASEELKEFEADIDVQSHATNDPALLT